LVSHHSLNLCLEVADAIVDSLGLLVELPVSEEFGMETPVEGGIGGCLDGMEGGRRASKGVEEPLGEALSRGLVGEVKGGI